MGRHRGESECLLVWVGWRAFALEFHGERQRVLFTMDDGGEGGKLVEVGLLVGL